MSEEESAGPGEAGSAGPSTAGVEEGGGGVKDDGRFECNICLDTAKDAVISMCGHLFCWPCLHQWLETRPSRQLCPVCKSGISREKVIPLYGRNGDGADPRERVPPRPSGQRSEAPAGFPGFHWGGGGGADQGGFQFSFGIGAFPFGLFATHLNFGDRRPGPPNPNTRQYEEEQNMSRTFILIAVIFMFWLVFVA